MIGFTAELGGPSEGEEPQIGHNGGPALDTETAERIAKIPSLSTQDILRLAHKKLLGNLLEKLEDGSITHQEMAILRNVMKDNGMILGVPPIDPAGPAAPLPAALPSFEKPDWEDE